jgi:hypothetical protein
MTKAEAELGQAQRDAAEALRLCLAGDEAAGIARYRACALPGFSEKLRLGLHAGMIENAGRPGAAEALRRIVIAQGGDLTRASARPNTPPETAIEEYETWFARGLGNAAMVNGYVRALASLGRTDRVAEIFDAERLIHIARLGDPTAVARTMIEAEDSFEQGSIQITHHMRYLLKLEQRPDYAALLALCRAETAAYFARWAASDHPLANLVPRDFAVSAWAMIARAEGYNARHQHPFGLATGVYYPAGLPQGSVGGQLRIGGWEDPPPPGWPSASITPEPGLLVLLPSWYVHWTDPIEVEGTRLAITIDAIPTTWGQAQAGQGVP